MDLLTILNFGIIDNLVLCIAFYFTYLNLEIYVEKYFQKSSEPFLLGVISAGISNSISDGLGFFLQMEFKLGLIVTAGCLIGMLIIPIMEIIKDKKRKQ